MATAHPHGLQIAPPTTAAALTPQQKRFNRLIGQIAAARQTLAAWHEEIPRYHQAHLKRLEPLLVEIRAARRAAVHALDALLNEPGWSRAETEGLRDSVCERAAQLIGGEDAAADAEMRALFDKHAEVDFETAQRESGLALKDAVEAMTGVDLGDDDGIESAGDLFERFERQREAEAGAAAARREGRKKTAAQRRRDDEAQGAAQSVRQVYRQLASALHPDRETDAERRDIKTALMQRVNGAYAANDLLGLLELQLEIERVDAKHLEGASAERLAHYNKVLAAQLDELRHETLAVQARFEADFGLDTGRTLDPRKLGTLVDQGWRELAALLDAHHHEQRMLADRKSAKRWLKERRRQPGSVGGDFFA